MRVVIDTNVVVSAFLSPAGAPALVFDQWRPEKYKLVVSEPILAEYQRALSYDRVRARHRMTTDEISRVSEGFRQFSLIVPASGGLKVVKDDPEDDKFLECAIQGNADHIVSGDSHLLSLREYRGIQILTPAAFLNVLQEGERERVPRP